MCSTSSNFNISVGLFIKTNVLASGYNVPSFAFNEQRTAAADRADTNPFDTKTYYLMQY